MLGINILLAIIILLVVFAIGYYNSLVKARVRTKEAWSDIDVQLKRRYDLIPNLVDTVKGYAKHEKEVLNEVARARSALMNATSSGNVKDVAGAENMLTGALKSLFAVAEAYPELKANKNFERLQMELSDTENKIQAARRFYNANVANYNIKLDTFPGNLFASVFGFKKDFDFFDLEDSPEERENVKVDFEK